MNYTQYIQSKDILSKLAEGLEYNSIKMGDVLMVHKNNGSFQLVVAEHIARRMAQGWIECVSDTELIELLGEAKQLMMGWLKPIKC